MEIKEIKLDQIQDLVSLSSPFFLPTGKDVVFDAIKFCQKFIDKGILKLFATINDNGQKIGYISLLINAENNSFDIGPMFVLSEYSGQGLGKKQVEFVINFAKNNNFSKIDTRTWGQNFASRKIFESLDFIKTDEVENDRINGDSTVYYQLTLS